MEHTHTHTDLKCAHCGDECRDNSLHIEDKVFCCQGCQSVYLLLKENNLCDYYELNKLAGNSLKGKSFDDKFAYLDVAEIAQPLYDFYSPSEARITLYLPSIHCSSCIWLLENFHKIKKGVLQSRVQFLKKELALVFDPSQVSLRQIVELLATIGYEPSITLNANDADTYHKKRSKELYALLLRLGVVGFALGNVMLMSFPAYLGIDAADQALYGNLFRYLNLALSVPVVAYGASPFWYSAWTSLRQKNLNIDVPITLGILMLFVRSVIETVFMNAEGYYDSLSGLVFLLLIGRYVQQITYEGLNFQRDYKSYFPLAATVVLPSGAEQIKSVNNLVPTDHLRLRPQELVPADSILISENALVDYSFVTGEAEPQHCAKGQTIFAGGRIMQNIAELTVQKPCSHSYLTQLWNKDEFVKPKDTPTTRTAELFAHYFTYITLAIATAAGGFWLIFDSSLALNAFTAVLVVACPCALTLSMPFTMGMAMAILGKNKFYVRNSDVIQHLAEANSIVFDKTGTLTDPTANELKYEGRNLTAAQWTVFTSMASHSTHPLSQSLARLLKTRYAVQSLDEWHEVLGCGIECLVDGQLFRLGKIDWVSADRNTVTNDKNIALGIDGTLVGYFGVQQVLRKGVRTMLTDLATHFRLALLTGDNKGGLRDIESVLSLIPTVRTNQQPADKMHYIAQIQADEKAKVVMIGDGLNDAGALRQANVGIALTQDAAQFSPSSDVIADAQSLYRLADFVLYARTSVKVVKWSFLLSLVYNFVGLSVAVSGHLSPVFAAVFMPLSSISVVTFGVGMTALYARKFKL
ncbi:Cu+-exporting ATPase [Flexibacter flexilis DSM 6793]|uniref:Cu+-exporting ATPase n=1 Tax=Flexibacter flexilis DSM 6793 TaxID=927664 RepID=A0A1I1LF89_9BACT|nr:heavy metal translocating P-type ATPase metal-binding domain-containing protein [Flexibacter flexilis]SFC68150.1 Cu+-exporting ATPase [Flexibacter flexilis DSM 6793]